MFQGKWCKNETSETAQMKRKQEDVGNIRQTGSSKFQCRKKS